MTPRVRALLVAVLLVTTAAVAPDDASGAPAPLDLGGVKTFAFAIGSRATTPANHDRLAKYDLVVLDGIDAPASLVENLRSGGAIVLGYLSVGTIERNRPWSRAARRYRLDRWPDWDEWFAATSEPGFRTLLTTTAAPLVLERGFDGLFLDNVDMIAEHAAQSDGMYSLVRELAGLVHARNGVLFAQNGDDVIRPVIDVLDGWNREDVSLTYDFDDGRYARVRPADSRMASRVVRDLVAAGLVVTTTDYARVDDASGIARAIARACAHGAIPYVSDIELDRVPRQPPRCD